MVGFGPLFYILLGVQAMAVATRVRKSIGYNLNKNSGPKKPYPEWCLGTRALKCWLAVKELNSNGHNMDI